MNAYPLPFVELVNEGSWNSCTTAQLFKTNSLRSLAGLPEEHADPRDAGWRVPLKVGWGSVRDDVRHFVGHSAAVKVYGVAAHHLDGHGATRALVWLRPNSALPHRELTRVPHGHAHCV